MAPYEQSNLESTPSDSPCLALVPYSPRSYPNIVPKSNLQKLDFTNINILLQQMNNLKNITSNVSKPLGLKCKYKEQIETFKQQPSIHEEPNTPTSDSSNEATHGTNTPIEQSALDDLILDDSITSDFLASLGLTHALSSEDESRICNRIGEQIFAHLLPKLDSLLPQITSQPSNPPTTQQATAQQETIQPTTTTTIEIATEPPKNARIHEVAEHYFTPHHRLKLIDYSCKLKNLILNTISLLQRLQTSSNGGANFIYQESEVFSMLKLCLEVFEEIEPTTGRADNLFGPMSWVNQYLSEYHELINANEPSTSGPVDSPEIPSPLIEIPRLPLSKDDIKEASKRGIEMSTSDGNLMVFGPGKDNSSQSSSEVSTYKKRKNPHQGKFSPVDLTKRRKLKRSTQHLDSSDSSVSDDIGQDPDFEMDTNETETTERESNTDAPITTEEETKSPIDLGKSSEVEDDSPDEEEDDDDDVQPLPRTAKEALFAESSREWAKRKDGIPVRICSQEHCVFFQLYNVGSSFPDHYRLYHPNADQYKETFFVATISPEQHADMTMRKSRFGFLGNRITRNTVMTPEEKYEAILEISLALKDSPIDKINKIDWKGPQRNRKSYYNPKPKEAFRSNVTRPIVTIPPPEPTTPKNKSVFSKPPPSSNKPKKPTPPNQQSTSQTTEEINPEQGIKTLKLLARARGITLQQLINQMNEETNQ